MSENEKHGVTRTKKAISGVAKLFHASVTLAPLAFCLVFQLHSADASEEEGIVKLEERQWATRTNGPFIRWPEAVAYCDDLALGGYEDWRLPTLTELETLYDPRREKGIRSPIHIEGCCLWSNTSLQERAAEDGDQIAGRLRRYRWGFMFDGGHSYYAGAYYQDGEALCVRDN